MPRFYQSWPPLGVLALTCLCFTAFGASPPDSEVARHVRDHYEGRIFLLRNFYGGPPSAVRGDSLVFDGLDRISGNASPGDWTVDGVVEVKKIHASGQRLILEAKRLPVASSGPAGLGLQRNGNEKDNKKKKETPLRITLEFGSTDVTIENADAALSQVFLTAQDRLAELVPDYWTACLSAAAASEKHAQFPPCHFSLELLAIPGFASPPEPPSSAKLISASTAASLPKVFQVGTGVSAPRPTRQTDPSFSEEARRARFQGTVMLYLIVDSAGEPRRIQIVGPIGYGLDRQAVATVASWKFNPAMKDGQPVAAGIYVEVDFHLY